MKVITILFLFLLASPVFGELTKEDLRTIVKEENAASETRMREYIDLKIEAVNTRIDGLEKSLNAKIDGLNQRIDDVEKNLNAKIDAVDNKLDSRIDDIRVIMIALIGLVAAAIVIPQIIIAYKEKGQKELQSQIDQLREQIEAMQQ